MLVNALERPDEGVPKSDALTGGEDPRDDGLAGETSILRFCGTDPVRAGEFWVLLFRSVPTGTMRFSITGLLAVELADEIED